MPHVTFVPFTGLRVREDSLKELGMSLPGLQARGSALKELPALGLLTLAGMLPADWTSSYLGYQGGSDAFFDQVIEDRPDIVAISSLTASTMDAYRFARQVQAAGITVVMGGLHVSMCPEEALRHCDSVVVGEGEAVWPQLLEDFTQGELERVYSSFVQSAPPPWVDPRFDLIPVSPPRFTLQTQRGCPLACDFCAASRLLGPFREKPISQIARELAAIGQLSSRPIIELADDNSFAGQRDPDELFEVLAGSGARYFTETDWRIGQRPQLLSGLANSGCLQVLVGVESLVFRYPGMGRKNRDLEQMMESVEAIQSAGVAVNGCFILGADGETEESIDRLVEFILESPFADVQITLQTPFPGTSLYRRLRQEKRLLTDRDWSFYTLFDVTFQPDRLTVEQLERLFRTTLREAFSPAATTRRNAIRKRIWKQNRAML